jgi:hypothetical protein
MGIEQTGHAWRCWAMIVTPQDGAPTRDADPIMAAPARRRAGTGSPIIGTRVWPILASLPWGCVDPFNGSITHARPTGSGAPSSG